MHFLFKIKKFFITKIVNSYLVFILLCPLLSSCFRDDKYDFYPVKKWNIDGVNIFRYYSSILKQEVIVDNMRLVAQGCAFRGDTLYRFYDGGYCGVYYINSKLNLARIIEYKLASFHVDNHMNCCQFDLSTGYLYSSELNRRVCNVEEINNDKGRSNLLQIITIDKSKLLGNGYVNIICGDDEYLWAFGGPVDKEDSLYFFKFKKPPLSLKEVHLSDKDVIDSWYIVDDVCMQGGTVHKGLLYFLSGTATGKKKLLIFDTHSKVLKKVINLDEIISEEPEDCDFYNNKLIITVFGGTAYYAIEF